MVVVSLKIMKVVFFNVVVFKVVIQGIEQRESSLRKKMATGAFTHNS